VAYGQKDPLLQYKKEAFEMFEVLVGDIEEESVRRIFRVELAPDSPQPAPRRAPARLTATKESAASAFSAMPQNTSGGGVAVADDDIAPNAPAQAARAQAAQGMPAAIRPKFEPRASRNDPCPCGSGKKYKKCHLPIDEAQG
jgi:preprotein translocase subunit SecA